MPHDPSDPSQALEAAIFADPTDLDAWRAYGDWLRERGDPRGELVSLDVRRQQLVTEQQETRLGEKVSAALDQLELEWKFGFLHSVTVRGSLDVLRALLEHESCKFVQKLQICIGASALRALATAQLPLLETLEV